MKPRTSGDDVDITVRVRRANLPALIEGIMLGVDTLTMYPITLQLVPEPGCDGVYTIAVEANAIVAELTPDAVDAHKIERESSDESDPTPTPEAAK